MKFDNNIMGYVYFFKWSLRDKYFVCVCMGCMKNIIDEWEKEMN